MTIADDLAALAVHFDAQYRFYRKKMPFEFSAEMYQLLANTLDDEIERCETDPILQKAERSVQKTITHMAETMEQLSRTVKELAYLRGRYVEPEGGGGLGPAVIDLEAMGQRHDKATRELRDLAKEVKTVATSVARYTGGGNSSQGTNDGKPYRVVPFRAKGEYRRGLRRSG